MNAPADRALSLIADLGEASARAHTEATLLSAVNAALARYFPRCRLDLRRGAVAIAALDGPAIRREAGSTTAVFPLLDAEGDVGTATLVIDGDAVELSRALLDAMGRVLAAALRQVQILGRVAAIARRAQGDKKQLRRSSIASRSRARWSRWARRCGRSSTKWCRSWPGRTRRCSCAARPAPAKR